MLLNVAFVISYNGRAMLLVRPFGMRLYRCLFACLIAYACGHISPALAEVPPSGPDWGTCVKAPTRSCVLGEALAAASAPENPSSGQLLRIAQAYVRAGNIDITFQIIPLIRGDGVARASALRSIASAEARSGRIDRARDLFAQALLLAESIESPLARAETTLSIAGDEEEAGFTAEAGSLFAATREIAQTIEIKPAATREIAEGIEIKPASGRSCFIMPSPEDRLDSVFGGLARHEAKVGDLKQALELARHIQYGPRARVAALQVIAEIMAGAGRSDDARNILDEARDIAGPTASWPDRHPSCPSMHFGSPDASYYVYSLCNVAKAQAKLGLADAAAVSLNAASRLVGDITDGSLSKPHDVAIAPTATSRLAANFIDGSLSKTHEAAIALTEIAEAESEAGLAARAREDLDRAMKAADGAGLFTLMRLGRALVLAGRSGDAQRLSESALTMARSREAPLERAKGLLLLVEMKDEAGLSHDRELLLETQEAVRLVGSWGERAVSLARLAQAWLRAGEMRQAVTIFEEALASLEAMDDRQWTSNLLQQVIHGIPVPGRPATQSDPRLAAAAAPHIMKIIQADGNMDARALFGRAEVLLMLAGTLPD